LKILIFHSNVSKFSRELRLGFTGKCIWKNENLNCGFSREAISLKPDQLILLPSIVSV